MKVCRIDKNGFYIEDVIVKSEEEIEEDMIVVECPEGLYSPRWDGKEWINGITNEEIEQLINQHADPTENEMIMLAIAELDIQRELDKTKTQLAIAELATTLLGGE